MPHPSRMRVGLTALALSLSLASLAAAAPSNPIPGELIVRFKPDANASQRSAALARVPGSASVRELNIIHGALVRFSGMSTELAIAELRRDSRVLDAEPNYEIHLDREPNDPRFPELYGMRNIGQTGGLPGADIRATLAWDLFTGDPNLKVGVIDTGIDWTHPDLAANIWTNPGEIAGNGLDDDGNGYVDDVHGYDVVNHDGNPMDDHGHGTHVSGTIAGVGDNGIGVAGVNWRLKLVGIKFLNSGGSGSTAGAIEAVQYAIAAGVRLTSNSWGGGAYSDALLAAINASGAAGQLFVAAAGNSGSDMDIFPHYPAGYDSPYVISVAATDHNDQLAGFSNYGVIGVDLAAPGVSILSTVPGAGYAVFSGTSMATPHVAGALALAAGRFPAATGLFLKELMLTNCDSLPSLIGRTHRARRLNAFQTILLPDSIPPSAVTDLAVESNGSTALGLTWTASGDDSTSGTASAYDLRYSLAPIDTGNFASATPATTGTPLAPGATEHVEVAGLNFNSTYFFALRVLDELGNPSPMSNVASGTTLGIPHIEVTPASLTESLLTGESSTQQLTVRNTGEGRLDFVAPTPEQLFASPLGQSLLQEEPDPGPGGGEPEPRPGFVGDRGPDRGGYRWRSSTDASGPRFDWVDISGNGTPVLFGGHDELSPAVPLGFEMPFYGRKLSSVHIGSDGYLTFLGTGSLTAHTPLPSSTSPADVVAPWWQDLGAGGPRSVLFRREPDRFVVSYLDVPAREPEAPRRTFQVILESSGRIVFQYRSLGSPRDVGTIGIQDPTRETGLVVSYNAPFVRDGQAIEFLPVGLWLSVSPLTGQVPAGGSMNLDVRFDATGLFGGDYAGAVLLDSNDPVLPHSRTPVALHVTGAPDIAVSPDSLDYAGLFIGAVRTDSLRVQNVGTQTLHISSVSCAPAVFTAPGGPFDIAPGGSLTLLVSFAPTDPVPYSGTLTIASDDHDEPSTEVRLAGLGLVPPDIAVAPSLLTANLFTGATADRALTITNTGGSDLEFRVRARRPPGPAPASGAPVAVPQSLSGPTANQLSPTPGVPTVHAQYTGTHLSFGVSDVGEVMPYQYPVGNEHLALGTFLAGYTLAYEVEGSDRLAYAVYASRTNIVPVSYQELENSATRTIVEVITRTGDGVLEIRRLFTFRKALKYVTIEARVVNVSGLPVTRLVYKENADWDVDGNFGNTWDYDRSRNLVHASLSHFVGIASGQEPTLMDFAGWDDYNRRTTFVDFPVGPVPNIDGLEVLHFELGTLGPAQGADVDLAYGAANSLTELQSIMDEAVSNTGWLSFDPKEGVIPAGGELVVNAHFDATGLNGGSYPADVHVTSNDPDESDVLVNALLNVTGAADIEVVPDSLHFGYPFAGTSRFDTLLVRNTGTAVLNLSSVATTGAPYFTPDGPGTLPPGASRKIVVRYSPVVRGAYEGALVLDTNDPDEGRVRVPLTGYARIPPDIAVAPADVSADLLTGDVATRTITITNSDAQELFWRTSIGAPAVVATSPVFGASEPSPDKTVRTTAPPLPSGGGIYVEMPGPIPHRTPIHSPGFVAEDGTLEQALANLDEGAAEIGAVIPGRYDFSEGVVGNNISDGGGDMYDGGNFLVANAGPIEYSNGVIVSSTAFGPGGRYFTRKYPGLFVLAADQSDVNTFAILGNLGADGSGNVDGSVLQVVSAGVTYRGFVKRVYAAGDPSVNHMVIVADAPGAGHSFATSTDDDFHQVSGLLGTRRLYYLLYAGNGGGYINDAAALEIMKAFLRVLRPMGTWLEVTPSAGVLSPGGRADVTALFRSAGLVTGDYFSDIHIESDDPDESDLVTHAHLHVTGAPDIAVEPDSLSFDTLFVGGTQLDSVEVANIGTDVLSVSSVTASPGHFLAPSGAFDLVPGERRVLGVTFAPTSPGEITGTLTIQSNDHDLPTATVALFGHALVAPDIQVSPDSLVAALFTGDTTQQVVTVRNTGGSDLQFQIRSRRPPGTAPASGAPVPVPQALSGPTPNTLDPTLGTPSVHAQYTGTHLSFGLTDFGEVMPYQYPVGNEHLAWGTWLSGYTVAYEVAGGDRVAYSVNSARSNMIPVSYRELENSATRAVVEVITRTGDAVLEIRRLFTFRKALKYVTVDARVVNVSGQPVTRLVYKENADWDVDGDFNNTWDYDRSRNLVHASETHFVGIASGQEPAMMDLYGWDDYNRRTTFVDFPVGPAPNLDGLEVLHFELGTLAPAQGADVDLAYGAANSLTELQAIMDEAVGHSGWLTFDPVEGVVPAGGELLVNARFDATGLNGGSYLADVHVTSNDPDESEVVFPARLQVTGVPRIAVNRDSIAFGSLFVGATRTDSLEVSNPGSDVLHVSAVTASPSHFLAPGTGFDLLPGDSRILPVTFAPTAVGVFDGTLEIASDAHGAPTVSVALFGEGLAAPDIAVVPESLTVSLFTGDTATRPLALQNTGGSLLTWVAVAAQAESLAASPVFTSKGAASGAKPASDQLGRTTMPAEPPAERVYVERAPGLAGAVATNSAGRRLATTEGTPEESLPATNESSLAGTQANAARSLGEQPAVSSLPLEQVLTRLDAGAGTVTAPIPSRHDFTEGVAGNSIIDGGADMYDSGNFLYGMSGPFIYTNGPIFGQPGLGAGGRYFTRKYPGLFVFAGDLGGTDQFGILGNLGADGFGFVNGTVFGMSSGGVNYRAFIKRVYGAGVPSVNHMIIVADAPTSVHSFSTNSDDDFHLVSGLSSCRRLYYLLFSSAGGGFISDAVMTQVFAAFVQLVNPAPPWLAVSPGSGSTPAAGESLLSVQLDATGMLGGDYRGAILVTSNDPDEAALAVPVALHVTGVPRLSVSRDSIDFGTLFTGATRSDTLKVRNVGTDLVSVTSVSAAPGEFSVPTTPFSVAVGAEHVLLVSYSPTVPGVSSGTLTLVSNDGVEPTKTVALSGTALEAPIAGVTPDSLAFELPSGGQQDLPLTLSNTGGSDLTFTIGRGVAGPPAVATALEDIRTSSTLPTDDGHQSRAKTAPLAPAFLGPMAGLGNVLLIADGGTEGDVATVLTSAGYTVTQVGDDSIYDGTNPPLTGFDLVVLLDGTGVGSEMPVGGQSAILNHVTAGGGLISFEWLAWEVSEGRYNILEPAIPLIWGSYADGMFTWNVTAAHPVTAGVSPSFNVSTTADLGTADSGSVLVTSGTGHPMVITKQVGAGNVVHFASAGNYFGYRPFIVPDMQRLLVNAADWLTGSSLLSVVPSSGTVPAHSSLPLIVTANAESRAAGTYLASLFISTNDPVRPVLTVPASVVVTGGGVAMSPAGGGSGSPSPGRGSLPLHETPAAAPPRLALHGVVPNPPVRDLMVSLSLPDAQPARLELLDLAGRRIRDVNVGSLGPGRHSVSLGGSGSLGSGVYLVRLRHGGRTLVSKCVLMR